MNDDFSFFTSTILKKKDEMNYIGGYFMRFNPFKIYPLDRKTKKILSHVNSIVKETQPGNLIHSVKIDNDHFVSLCYCQNKKWKVCVLNLRNEQHKTEACLHSNQVLGWVYGVTNKISYEQHHKHIKNRFL